MKILYIDCSFGFDATMLFGALVDAGADVNTVICALKEDYPDITVTQAQVKRNHIDCKRIELFSKKDAEYADKYPPTENTNSLTVKAVDEAIKNLGIDWITASAVPVSDGTDGEVISILERAGAELFPTEDTNNCTPDRTDAQYLANLTHEHGIRPDMDVCAVGYGTSSKDGFVIATIGYMNTAEMNFGKEAMEQYL